MNSLPLHLESSRAVQRESPATRSNSNQTERQFFCLHKELQDRVSIIFLHYSAGNIYLVCFVFHRLQKIFILISKVVCFTERRKHAALTFYSWKRKSLQKWTLQKTSKRNNRCDRELTLNALNVISKYSLTVSVTSSMTRSSHPMKTMYGTPNNGIRTNADLASFL